MKALILGESIFTGKEIAKRLISKGYDVYILNTCKHPAIKGVKHIAADRNDSAQMCEQLKTIEFDVVIDISVRYVKQTKIILNNLKGRVGHFIHIGSAEVYKYNMHYPMTEDAPTGYNENFGDYSRQMYLSENLLFEAHRKSDFPVTVLRPFYIYGPENNLYRELYIFQRLIQNMPILVPVLHNRKEIPTVKFLHVYDLANTVINIIMNKNTFGEAYNVGGLEHVNFVQWVDMCAKILRTKADIWGIDSQTIMYKAMDFFPLPDVHLYGSVGKLAQLGINPEFNVFDGLKQTYSLTPKKILHCPPIQTRQELDLRRWRLKGIV